MNESTRNTTHTSVLKIICGLEVILESELFGVTFSPQPASIKEGYYKTKGGVPFKKYMGIEVVNFKMEGMRGQFTHNASFIVDIACNFTDLRTLREVIAAIACYCRVDFEDSKAATPKELYDESFARHRTNTSTLIGISNKELKYINEESKQWGILRILRESEFQGRRPINALLTSNLQIKDLRTGQTIDIDTTEEKEPLGPLITISPGPLDEWLDPRRRLVRIFQRVMTRKEELLNSIRTNDWSWMVTSISEINQTDTAKRMASMAREYCSYMVSQGEESDLFSLPLIAFNYCFASLPGFSGRALDYETKMEWSTGITIALDASEGAMIFRK